MLPPRSVRFLEIIKEPNLTLKFYDVHFTGKPTDDATIEKVKSFLLTEIREGRIDPHCGLGFAMLTNDTMNVVRWNKDYPILVQNQVYGMSSDYTEGKLLDIREKNVGSFCIWEIGVVNFERIAWRKYQDSVKSEKDREEYLNAVIEGEL